MSIATEARVADLEKRVEELRAQFKADIEQTIFAQQEAFERFKAEFVRKPGPKPKDNNG